MLRGRIDIYVFQVINLVMGHKIVLQRMRRQVDHIDEGWGDMCTYVQGGASRTVLESGKPDTRVTEKPANPPQLVNEKSYLSRILRSVIIEKSHFLFSVATVTF